MRLTEPLPALEIVSLDIPDDDLVCSWPPCNATAVWWHECVCGYPIYSCEPHRAGSDAYCSRTPTGYVLCKRCKARTAVPIFWQPLR